MKRYTKFVAVCATVLLSMAYTPRASGDLCSSYPFTPIVCDDFDNYADSAALRAFWPADGTCAPTSTMNSLASGPEVKGTHGSLNVQTRLRTPSFLYSHLHDLTPQIQANPANTGGLDAINGAGPIDDPIDLAGVPAGYVDSMSRTQRPQALKGTFYFNPLEDSDGGTAAGLANMVYYHEIYLGDDRAPLDFTSATCISDHHAHDCNCSGLNQDATCDQGTCEGQPQCAGSCRYYECNGTCSGGPHNGEACTNDSQCSVCTGGPRDGQSCSGANDTSCKACDSGPNQGNSCTNNDSCGSGTCANGPRTGSTCHTNGDCGSCVGGNRAGQNCDEDWACQYSCGTGQQPVCEGGIKNGVACAEDVECTGTKFPILTRTDNQVHASLVIGLMAIYDNLPCDSDQGYWPSEWRLAVYDGKEWKTFQAPAFEIPFRNHPHYQDLQPMYGWNKVDFAIGADYIEVRLTNPRSQALNSGNGLCIFHTCWGGSNFPNRCDSDAECPAGSSLIPNEYTVARVPRQYKGPFNHYAIGPNRGRDLTDPQNPGPLTCMPALSSADVISDELVLYDGVFAAIPGGCCAPNLDCTDVSQAECQAAGGIFHGQGTACAATTCCHTPKADIDGDHDVDMADFAVLQRCLNLGGGTATGSCRCFDVVTPTGSIDAADVQQFADCAGGPGLAPSPACP